MTRRATQWVLPCALLVALWLLAPPAPLPAQERSSARRSYKATVALMTVNVAVFDEAGVPVDDLTPADFVLRADGEVREIAVFLTPRAAPLTVVLALDFSGSVRSAAPRAREAAATFLGALTPEDCVYVMPFRGHVARGRWLSGADPGKTLESMAFDGGTALYDAIENGLDTLAGTAAGASSPGSGMAASACRGATPDPDGATMSERRRALVVLTDGDDQDSVLTYPETLLRVREAGVPVFPVALGGAASPFFQGRNVGRILGNKRRGEQLEEIARSSGGLMVRARGSDGLRDAYRELVDALRASYVLGYQVSTAAGDRPAGNGAAIAPAASEDAELHDIEVTVRRPDVRIIGAQRRVAGR